MVVRMVSVCIYHRCMYVCDEALWLTRYAWCPPGRRCIMHEACAFLSTCQDAKWTWTCHRLYKLQLVTLLPHTPSTGNAANPLRNYIYSPTTIRVYILWYFDGRSEFSVHVPLFVCVACFCFIFNMGDMNVSRVNENWSVFYTLYVEIC